MVIYFRCPENPNFCGGIKKIYDQVDILNKNNIEAYVLHYDKENKFKCDWFPNNTSVVYHNDILINENDIVVFPEIYNHKMFDFYPNVKKVIFNQNAYNTFSPYGIVDENTIFNYNNKDLIGIMVVSEDNKMYLESFLDKKIHRIHISIDFDKFYPIENKKKQICYMPRKNKQDVNQVISILKLRNNLKDYNFVAIENMTEEELIKTYQESEIFLSFGYPEGCAAPPLEAMACGCTVVGYTGMGCKEYLNQENYCYPIEHGDILKFVKRTEFSSCWIKQFPELTRILKQQNINFIKNKYTKEREEKDILEFWNEILRKCDENVL